MNLNPKERRISRKVRNFEISIDLKFPSERIVLMKLTFPRILLLASVVATFATAQLRAELLYATNGTNLASFDSATPSVTTVLTLSGLQTGETIVGFDLRPANGLLYGIGSSSRLYTINTATGAVTQIGAAGAFTLNGTSFGMDFNPTVDRIRLVSDTEQNLRINPDGTLTATDAALNPAGNVVAVAYSNNFVGGGTTTLYSIDSSSGVLGIISVPNSGGPINAVGSLGLGTSLSGGLGFDISGRTGTAYASILTGGLSRLYSINLTTGAASLIGTIGTGAINYSGLAAPIPEPSTYMLLAVGAVAVLVYRRRASAKA